MRVCVQYTAHMPNDVNKNKYFAHRRHFEMWLFIHAALAPAWPNCPPTNITDHTGFLAE